MSALRARDLALEPALLDGGDDTTLLVDLREDDVRLLLHLVGEVLDVHLVAWHPVDALAVQALQLYEVDALLYEERDGLLRALRELIPGGSLL